MSECPKNFTNESEQTKRKQSETKFNQLIEICTGEGWFPTECPEGCIVEPDGICPHKFKSIALELGLV